MSLHPSAVPFHRFATNHARCFRMLSVVGVENREIYPTGDILRGALVLAHASLEDLLRSIARYRWDMISDDDFANDLPFPGTGKANGRFGDLLQHKEKAVAQVLQESLAEFKAAKEEYLSRKTFNN